MRSNATRTFQRTLRSLSDTLYFNRTLDTPISLLAPFRHLRTLAAVLDLAPFQNLQLRGGFRILRVALAAQPLLDPIERAATAQVIIRGKTFEIFRVLSYSPPVERDIELLLLKLTDGSRILRFSDPVSGLCLEKRLDPQQPVHQQKSRWEHVFLLMLQRELGRVE